jgi:hypothetical protein
LTARYSLPPSSTGRVRSEPPSPAHRSLRGPPVAASGASCRDGRAGSTGRRGAPGVPRCDLGLCVGPVAACSLAGTCDVTRAGAKQREWVAGDRVGRLTLVRRDTYRDAKGRRRRRWLCTCDCGGEIVVCGGSLSRKRLHGDCGCGEDARYAATAAANTTTGSCAGCGASFDKWGQKVYCTTKCAHKFRGRRRAARLRESEGCNDCGKVNDRKNLARCSNCSSRKQESHQRRKYGTGLAEVVRLHGSQGGRCGACLDILRLPGPGFADDGRRKAVRDHCHTTGRTRALLCSNCNTALGLLGEDPRRIAGLLRYAKKIRQHTLRDEVGRDISIPETSAP